MKGGKNTWKISHEERIAPLQKGSESRKHIFQKTKNQVDTYTNSNKEKKIMRFTREMLIEELNNRGFVAEEQTIVKNGIELSGITVKKSAEDRVAPTI